MVTDGVYAYAGMRSASSASVVRVRMADLTRVDAVQLQGAGEVGIRAITIDSTATSLYVAVSGAGVVVKLSTQPFARVGAVSIPAASAMQSVYTHPFLPLLYATSLGGKFIVVNTTTFSALPRQLTLPLVGNTIAVDALGAFAYLSTYSFPARVMQVRLADVELMQTLTLDTGEDASEGLVLTVAPQPLAYVGVAGAVVMVSITY